MDRQAFIILAHGCLEQLDIILDCLQDEDFDIYLHLDAGFEGATGAETYLASATERYPNLTILPRMHCYWGTMSLVNAEIEAFASVLASGRSYTHIHLISGNDMPIKSNAEIKEFFGANAGRNFLSIYPHNDRFFTHIRCRYPFPRCFQRKGMAYIPFRLGRLANTYYHILEKALFVHKWRYKNVPFKKGSQWASVTPEFASYLATEGRKFAKEYSHSLAPDEYFLGTLLYSSPFVDTLVNDNKRYIRWSEAFAEHPDELSMADYDAIMSSDAFFARKFNITTDKPLILRIRQAIKS
ncbi:MAG: hypothetical protein HUJ95_02645 [Bacteroidales bacterium]|nr:hypothetical protein [Bacteroidales bacterium]